MELAEWIQADQICRENLEFQLQYWREFLAQYEELPLLIAASPTLEASINRHTQLLSRCLQLLDQRQSFLDAFLVEQATLMDWYHESPVLTPTSTFSRLALLGRHATNQSQSQQCHRSDDPLR